MANIIQVGDGKEGILTSSFPLAKFEFEHFNPVQSSVLDFYNTNNNVIIAASTGIGKAQPLTSNILTPNGFVKMGEIKVNDLVIGSDGKPCVVTGVYPQGKKEIFKVTFSDQTYTHCCDEHLWAVRTKGDKFLNKPYKIKSLKEIKENLYYVNGEYKWFVPVVKPVEFTKSDLPLNPYLLGFLLGDGNITKAVRFSTADWELVDKISKIAEKNNIKTKYISKYDYNLISTLKKKVGCNYIINVLCDLKLFKLKSHEKFIPDIYKFNSIEDRIEILRGLMDTDGDCPSDGRAAFFNTSSEQLMNDVLFIARSLGATPTLYIKDKTTYTYKGKKLYGKKSYRVRISIDNINPFWLQRKAVNYNFNPKQGRTKSIIKVEPAGEENCQCIKVSAKDHLYVTDDFILTHNTNIAEMFLANEIRTNKKSGLFLVPFRSLASEKLEDWSDTSHHFSDLKISASTGDNRTSSEELEESDVVVMSMEMLNSKSRNSDNFISKSGMLVVDEAHSIGVKGRGAHLEAGIIKYCRNNPKGKIVFLSATLPNVSDVGKWLCKLTNRDNIILESQYRNCPLDIHYRSYDDSRGYKFSQESMIDGAVKLLRHYKDDKFLIFTPSKARGKEMEETIKELRIDTGFHHANLSKTERKKLESKFKTDPNFRVLVTTSGLSAGINTPARRVIVLGVHRGNEELPVYDILQQAGRAGRPKYDDRGDAYIFVPQSKVSDQIHRISNPPPIKSQMYDSDNDDSIKTVGFHLLSEINNESIKNKNNIVNWYEDTFAKSQGMNILDKDLDDIVLSLSRCGAITNKDELNITSLGKAATIFYFSPWDASDVARNLSKVFLNKKYEDDYWVSYALANLDSNRTQILSNAEKETVAAYDNYLTKSGAKNAINSFCPPGVLKYAYAYYCILTGYYDIELEGLISGLRADMGRICELIGFLNLSCKWGRKEEVDSIRARLVYGVPAKLVPLIKLDGIGRVKAMKLYDHGIKNPQDLINSDVTKITVALGCSRKIAENYILKAKELQ